MKKLNCSIFLIIIFSILAPGSNKIDLHKAIETGNLELDTTPQNSNSSSITITRNAFDKLVGRISTLEIEVKQLKQHLAMKDTGVLVTDGDDGDVKPVRRLLRKHSWEYSHGLGG